MLIAVPKEIKSGERRVALTPEVASKLIKKGFEVILESDAGLKAGFTNEQYEKAGAKIVNSAKELYEKGEIILKVQRPQINEEINQHELELMKEGQLLISFMYALHYPQDALKCSQQKVNVIAMDMIPRTTLAQRMDALSSQANIAGYKSVILSANYLGKIFPMMMTAAGTIQPARVVIMGAGVAGLSALGTAKRLGAIVEVSDIRPTVKEEVESLGGRFIEVETTENMQDERGYAKQASEEFLRKQKEVISKHVSNADIVITTALVPGKKAPILVTEEMIKNMRPNSVILDMATEFGGNCELSENGKIINKYGVTIIGEPNLPSLVPYHASDMYAKNLLNLIEYASKEGKFNHNMEDEILKGSTIVKDGQIVNDRVNQILNN
ncbi:MAG: Re/Si-specific NAD(P)(+) transhydrogenase subunit alpha [Ignavibacteriales bacterium]